MITEKPYSQETMKLNTNEGFIELFYEKYRTSKTMLEAYERTEEIHCTYFGRYRFASYDSFRHILKDTLRKRK